MNLIPQAELPDGFQYPNDYLRVIEMKLVTLGPWWFFTGEPLVDRLRGLRDRFPGEPLVPFARREDNDDVACWEVESGGVCVLHDFAAEGWERRRAFPAFREWLHVALDEALDF